MLQDWGRLDNARAIGRLGKQRLPNRVVVQAALHTAHLLCLCIGCALCAGA